jgi:ElaB/YqjD/DUF883 family membrane-anchored ribosome-binding protein
MELYYRDLISEDACLEKLVDDLMLVVQGAEEFAEATGASLPKEHQQELASRLQELKEGCRHVQQQARATALAVDKVIRQYPYSSAGIGFGLGLVAGILIKRLK